MIQPSCHQNKDLELIRLWCIQGSRTVAKKNTAHKILGKNGVKLQVILTANLVTITRFNNEQNRFTGDPFHITTENEH